MRGLRTGVAIAVTAVLMGGAGAYAQSQITSAQIKNNTITSADIKNKSITSSDLSASTVRSLAGKTGPAGPQGPAGPPGATVQGSQTAGPQGLQGERGPAGPSGVAEVEEITLTVPNDADDEETVINQAVAVCPDGKRVISGGYMHDTAALAEIFSNTP